MALYSLLDKTAQNILCFQILFKCFWLAVSRCQQTLHKFFEELPVGMKKESHDHLEESCSHESLLAD